MSLAILMKKATHPYYIHDFYSKDSTFEITVLAFGSLSLSFVIYISFSRYFENLI